MTAPVLPLVRCASESRLGGDACLHGGASAKSRRVRSMKLPSAGGLAWSAGPLFWSLGVADEAGGVELDQQVAQLVELCRSELVFQFGFDLGDDVADRSRGGVSSVGEADAFEALVLGIVVAGEVAELLHLSEQVIHGSPVV